MPNPQSPINLPSPNHDDRDGQAIDMLVMHYTGMKSATLAMERLTDPESNVSAHYVVDEQGGVFSLVPEEMRAWHAGVAHWRGQANINQRSIGIEITNPGHEFGYRPFPEAQMQSVIALSKEILARHDIPSRNVIAHSDVAPTRKQDPGELFDWAWLAKEGIGVMPQVANVVGEAGDPSEKLAEYGYDVSTLPAAITAFQRHFRPNLLSGQWDAECEAALQALLNY